MPKTAPSRKPNMAVFGPSGSGKTTSLRNLDPATTLVLNIESQAFPFSGDWPYNYFFESSKEVLAFAEELKTKPKWKHIRVVVLDSFGAFNQQTYMHEWQVNKSKPEGSRDGWAVINNTNNAGNILLHRLRQASHFYSIVLGHDEFVTTITPTQVRIVKHCMEHPKGKEWQGKIERLFVFAFLSSVQISKDANAKAIYKFRTQSDGIISAKSPMNVFENLHIDNDLRAIINRCEEFYWKSSYDEMVSKAIEDRS